MRMPISRVQQATLYVIRPAPASLPLDALLASIHSAYPMAKVVTLALSPSSPAPNLAYSSQVQLPKHAEPSTIFVDQYTARVLGKIDGMSVATAVHEFHTDMLLGDRGAFVMMLIACLLILLSLSGIVLWWPRKILTVRWIASGRRINFDVHNAIGFYSFVIMFLFGVTGVVVHWQSKWLPMANGALGLPDTEPDLRIGLPSPSTPVIPLEAVAAAARHQGTRSPKHA